MLITKTNYRKHSTIKCNKALTVSALLLMASSIWGAQPSAMFAGAAKSNITPSLGLPLIGNWTSPPCKYIHDELYARCMVLSNDNAVVAFVVCDLLGVSRVLSDEARTQAEKLTGIPAANIMISAVHTHSAPNAIGEDRRALRSDLSPYGKFTANRIADAVACAAYTLREAEIGWTTADAPEHVFCRRWYLKPETMPVNPFGSKTDKVKMNPGYQHLGLDKPAGPTDPEVFVLAARTPDGKPIGMLANYSLHYVGGVGGAVVSADYYGVYNERMCELLGAQDQHPPFISLLSNGTSGDINSCDYANKPERYKAFEKMNIVAESVAQKVFTAYQQIKWQRSAVIGCAFEDITLGLRRPTPEQLQWAEQVKADPEAGKKNRLAPIYAERVFNMKDYPPTWDFPLQVFRIGEVGISTFPFEVFAETGLELKKRSPLQPAFTVSLAHGYYGYLPPPEQHELGGYETWLGTSKAEKQATVKIVERLLTMLASLKDK